MIEHDNIREAFKVLAFGIAIIVVLVVLVASDAIGCKKQPSCVRFETKCHPAVRFRFENGSLVGYTDKRCETRCVEFEREQRQSSIDGIDQRR